VAPLVGRAAAFSQLVSHYQQARQGQPQAVLLVGEAGIGKTRLASEFVGWAQAQGAEVLSGHALEMGGRLPYQPLVEALRPRLEEENAPEDLLDDLWLAELSRLLPELRVRYPDLPTPTEDELTAKLRLFEAVARLVDALAKRTPLVLLVDDLHWIDGASLDLLRYLGHDWLRQRSRVLLLLTVRREGWKLNAQLAAELSDLGRDLPVSQVSLQPLSQSETLQLLEAVVGAHEPGTAAPSPAVAAPASAVERPLVTLGDVLFAQTEGQPLYLLETLKLWRERAWLLPQRAADGSWRLALAAELAYHARAAGESEVAYRSSVQAGMEAAAIFAVEDAIEHYQQARALLQAHHGSQSELPTAEVERLYVHLGQAYAFQNAWDKAQEAYEELLAYAQHKSKPSLASLTYNRLALLALHQAQDRSQVRALLDEAWQMAQTSHDQKALAETALNLAQIAALLWEELTNALRQGELALSLARTGHDQELEARCLFTLGVIHLRRGDFEEAMSCAQASLALYARLRTVASASGELSLPYVLLGAPLTQLLTHRATEAMCWALLALAQVQAGQVQPGIRSSRRALALAQESKSVWAQVSSTTYLARGLLEAGAYEEALGLMHHTRALARTLPQGIILQGFHYTLGSVYDALQQWDEARKTLEEAVAGAERLGLGLFHVSALSQLCMHYAEAGEWEAAYQYALKAIALRKSFARALIAFDFSLQYETEALLRAGEERQAKEAVQRLGERLGNYQRFRLPYLRSSARLSAWEGQSEQAIGHLREAAGIAVDLGLPAEQWQIQAALGRVYEARGEQGQAHSAWTSADRIIQELAQGIKDEALRSRFLAGPQIQPVVQHAQRLAKQVPKDHT